MLLRLFRSTIFLIKTAENGGKPHWACIAIAMILAELARFNRDTIVLSSDVTEFIRRRITKIETVNTSFKYGLFVVFRPHIPARLDFVHIRYKGFPALE